MAVAHLLATVLVVAAAATSFASSAVKPATLRTTMEEMESAFPDMIDISLDYVVGMPTFGSPHGLGPFFHSVLNMTRGDFANVANFSLTTHTGTHLDAPGHFNQTLMAQGYDVASLDLRTLNGPCLVVDTPRDKNITAEVMRELNIPRGVKRVLFKTLNTDRKLLHQHSFDGSYTGFTTDGAQYLVDHTDIKLVGIDYLSIGVSNELTGVHRAFLNTKVIIPVEALKLDDVAPGIYNIGCHPLKLKTLDGSPARCLLTVLTRD